MDEATRRALARHEQRTNNANDLYLRADGLRERAAKIDEQLALPDHERPVGDETILALEAKLLRQQADELTRDANGIQERLIEPPSKELSQNVENLGKAALAGTRRHRKVAQASQHAPSSDDHRFRFALAGALGISTY